ncbi:chemotaxis protein CheB [Fischerella thermalis CCMEE 5319]|nr:chemotaxis protein CheB [Fischerella thermalis CCMEE 5319]
MTSNNIALSPDLTIQIENINSPGLFPQEQGLVRVVVTNEGEGQFAGPLDINLYASIDSDLDSPLNEGNLVGEDELLGSVDSVLVNLSPGESQEFTIDFAGSEVRNPSVVAPGSYYLIAGVEAANYVAESNTENNLGSTHVSVNNSDVVIDWNATALNAVQNTRKFAPIAARDLAIVHAAIYDAVNAIDRSYDPYLVSVEESVAEGASLEAAAAAAAYTALVDLFPTQTAEFDLQFKRSLAEIPDDAAKLKGIELGTYVAEEILEIRSTDGADIYSGGFYEPGTEAGEWRPTPPNYLPAGFSEWGKVTPFVIPSVDDYLGEGFPELTSEQYAAEINETKALGSVDSTLRTDDQTEIAKFWSFDRIDSFGVTGFWNQIAEEIAIQQDNTLVENARLFALLNFGQADSGIAVLASKYNFGLWRPVTAIREADNDGNPDTVGDPEWMPLLTTPPNPEYLAGHSIGAGAAVEVLTDFFGEDFNFTITSPETPGISRSYGSFYEAGVEDSLSRIYGGVHYPTSANESFTLGLNLGNYVVNNALV